MKLTAILLLSACITASAAGHAQKVSISVKNASLKKVFAQIEKQAGYTFIYAEDVLGKAAAVSINIKEATVEEALAICFKDQPLTYSIVEKVIIVKAKPLPNDAGGHSGLDPESIPPIDITGKVTDADGNPLAGASVKVKGTSNGTATNNDGVFVLKGVDENATLEISFLGYETYTVAVNNKTTIVASLKLKPESLGEVVINKGYYTEKQKYSVGNVGKVTAKDLEKQPVNNVLLALEGRVAGLILTQNTGMPGSGINILIQGKNSIGRGNDPLYIVDGVPFNSQLLPNLSVSILGKSGNDFARQGNFGSQGGNPLNYLNINDIENVEVLKDADATAIYGSRAANGAILITTKRGKAGKTKVDFNIQNGWGKVTRKLDLLNTQEYLQMRREALNNDGINPSIPPNNQPASQAYSFADLKIYDSTRYTDWQKELIGGTAQYTNIIADVSGGNSNTQYLVGGSFHRETTVFPGDFSDKKGAFHLNLNSTSNNKKFKLQSSINYLVDINRLMLTDITSYAMTRAPNAPTLYDKMGNVNWGSTVEGYSTFDNPVAYLYQHYNNKTTNLIGNLQLSYQILPKLEFVTNLGYNNLQSDEVSTYPLVAVIPESKSGTQRGSQFSNNNINAWNAEPQINYNFLLGNGKVEVLAGTTFLQNNGNGKIYTASGFNSDLLLENIKSASSLTVGSATSYVYKYSAVFGRINYNLQDKYIINLTGRRDGSSRFGARNQFHNFGSIGAGWIFTSENIFKDDKILSFGKVRASYGTTGNDQIGDYQYLNLYSPSTVGVPYQGVTGTAIGVNGASGLYNESLQWEETKKFQLGMDLGFLKNRINLSGTYFNNRSSNELLTYLLPITTGFDRVFKNFPATVENSGWEFLFNSSNLSSKKLKWETYFNLTIPKNKLLRFENFETSSYTDIFIVGRPITIDRVYKFAGVNPTSGLYQFIDSKGNTTSNPVSTTDKYIVINTSPRIYGGLGNTLTFGGLHLDFFFQFVKRTSRNDYHFGNSVAGYYSAGGYNQPATVLARWQKAGDISSIQKFNSTYSIGNQLSYAQSSDASYEDASFLRLKNVSISYSLNDQIKGKLRMQGCRIFLLGQNLSTFTKFKGLDPETLSSTSLPPLRVITLGMQVTF